MRGPRCPRCHQSEWQLIHNDEQRQRWPVTCGETIYQCVECGQLGIRSWVETRGIDPYRRSFRDTWSFPSEPESTQLPPTGATRAGAP